MKRDDVTRGGLHSVLCERCVVTTVDRGFHLSVK